MWNVHHTNECESAVIIDQLLEQSHPRSELYKISDIPTPTLF